MRRYRVLTSDGKVWFVSASNDATIANVILSGGTLWAGVQPAPPDNWTIAARQIVAWMADDRG